MKKALILCLSLDAYNVTDISDVFVFPKFRKVDKFVASIERPKAKNALASGGLCPSDPLTKDSVPGPR